ncbi:MAG: hypothetical protein GXP63_02570, partial [DPANN group archaeon]|nr:hypothetical protein [DPANN group archaeon]
SYKNWWVEIGVENDAPKDWKEYWIHYIHGDTNPIDDGAVSPYAIPDLLIGDNFEYGADLGSTGLVQAQEAHNVMVSNVASKADGMYPDSILAFANTDGSETTDVTDNRRMAWISITHGVHFNSYDEVDPADPPPFLDAFRILMDFIQKDRSGHTIEHVLPLMHPDQNIVSGGHALRNDAGKPERYLVFATAGTDPIVQISSEGLQITRIDTTTGTETSVGTTHAGSNTLAGTGHDTAWWIESRSEEKSQETQNLLNYLEGLPSRPSDKVLSGQMGEDAYGPEQDVDNILAKSDGIKPALVGADYTFISKGGKVSVADVNNYLINYYAGGGLVTVSMHPDNPVTGGNRKDTTPVDIDELITDGTSTNLAYRQSLDEVAAGLQQLQDNGVSVLFRSLHEMNGGWFWWGKIDPQDYKNLWIYTHDYLIYTKGLHNLIWIYSPNANSGNYLTYYPGNDYVDIVGLDYYGSGQLPKLGGYDDLLTTGKPFGISEFGFCSSSGSGCDTPRDSKIIIDGIRDNMPDTIYWLNWAGVWQLGNNYNVKELLEDPWVVNSGEIG